MRFRPYLAKKRMNKYEYAFDIFKKEWLKNHEFDFTNLKVPVSEELVSIILPVYNGDDFLGEAIESVLSQTYRKFELIAVDDGSTDNSGKILDHYATIDERIKVIHKKNSKLPAALNTGFHVANGEFLTWLSHDNRLKPNFLAKMIDCLNRHPLWDAIYSNIEIIGEDGEPLLGSFWYEGYQLPHGSNNIFLPPNRGELNTVPNNYVGASFLYRARAGWLLGNYNERWFTLEDYDYWMRMNALFNLRHTDFDDRIYEYRFHNKSLTSNDLDLHISDNRKYLFAFETFRRDHYLSPTGFYIQDNQSSDNDDILNDTRDNLKSRNFIEYSRDNLLNQSHSWLPIVNLTITNKMEDIYRSQSLNSSASNILIWLGEELPIITNTEQWDFFIHISNHVPVKIKGGDFNGWFSLSSIRDLPDLIDILAKNRAIGFYEEIIHNYENHKINFSVIITSYRRPQLILTVLESISQQEYDFNNLEVIVVNNDPSDTETEEAVTFAREKLFLHHPEVLRYTTCKAPGISNARNVGICSARGKYIAFIDDDAVASPNWLTKIEEAFDLSSEIGLVGGRAILVPPEPRPKIVYPGWEYLWGQMRIVDSKPYEVQQWWQFPWGLNWVAKREALIRIGGFRSRYGRNKKDFSGGEEIVAAHLIQSLGYKIYIAPDAVVFHHVEKSRFSFKHVWKTISTGQLTNYMVQRDLYGPIIESIPSNIIQTIKSFGRFFVNLLPFSFKPSTSLLNLLTIIARIKLLRLQIYDFYCRFKKPEICK
jgi:glycosyltransferase involved in cell wall biosynthesis